MNSKGTVYLFLVALLLLAFILVLERRIPDTAEIQERTVRLFPAFSPGQVSRVEIVPNQSPLIRLDRTNEQWFLNQPFSFPAYPERVRQFLDTIRDLTSTTRVSALEVLSVSNQLGAFGLDVPQAMVILRHSQDRIEFRVGHRTPLGSQVYLQIVGMDGLFVVNDDLLEALAPAADYWRDPYLLRLKSQDCNRLEVRMAPPFGFSLQRDSERKWHLQKPMSARADTARIDLLLHELRQATALRFLPDSARTRLDTLGLQPPQLELVLGQGTNDLATIYFGHATTNTPPEVLALNLQYSNVCGIPKELVDKLRVSYTDLRDRHLFSESLEHANLIEIRAEETFTLQKLTNESWRMTSPVNMPADKAMVREFLLRLGQMEILEFTKDVVTDFAIYGLAPAARHYSLKTIPVSPNLEAAPTRTNEVDFGTNQVDRVLARRGDESSVYAVRLTDFERLPTMLHHLRDRQIWDSTVSNIVQINLTTGGQTLKLSRSTNGVWSFGSSAATLPDPLPIMLEELGTRLVSLRANPWVARGEDKMKPFGFLKPEHLTVEIVLSQASEPLILEFGDLTPRQGRYAAVLLDRQRLVFETDPSLGSLELEIRRQLADLPPAR
ncbi:MAG TPA: DUF4340 domain-containing protein [Candidatus Paceibacterota bacterium]|nr:DUF4340 domain-containing protein [Candidatus Paceibacterota bacterium]